MTALEILKLTVPETKNMQDDGAISESGKAACK